MKKTCFKCGVEKAPEDFYRHPMMGDGRLGKCKECTKRDVSERYMVTREARSAYEAVRNKRPERKKKTVAYLKKMRQLNPMKFKAHVAVARALRGGKLVKGPCQICGTNLHVQGHHEDYSKPLEVEWLCFKCHREHRHGQVVVSNLVMVAA